MALAISFALLVIVLLAVIAGALLPFLLQRCGLDPAHAGPSCQVLMDVFGVFCVCFVCDHILASAPTPAPTVAAPLS
jgi:Mg/Co/Ni transporter MgtE